MRAVQDKVAKAKQAGEATDYLTFVPDGEPALDANLGRGIELLRRFGLPVAVITNVSLLWQQDVWADLMAADWVSLKVDAVQEETWRRINRLHRSLELVAILEGVLGFAGAYEGLLVRQTMLAAGINDGDENLRTIASFLARLRPAVAYLSIPTRPPAEAWVRAPNEAALNQAYQILRKGVERAEYLIGYEGDAFASTGDVEEDLLAITAVLPMREDGLSAFLARAGADHAVVHRLVAEGQLLETDYRGSKFYLRKLA